MEATITERFFRHTIYASFAVMFLGGMCVLFGIRAMMLAVPAGGGTTAGLGTILFGIAIACAGALLRYSANRSLSDIHKNRERTKSNARARQTSSASESGLDAFDYRQRGRSRFGQRHTF